jgi:ferredoxin
VKTVIYYFTGTGNSLAVARDLKKVLGGDTELISIASLMLQDSVVCDAGIVGIVYPAWLHHIPPLVEDFVKKLSINDAYVFAVCVYAVNPGNSLFNLNSLLMQRGGRLDAGFTVPMGGKYVLLKDITFPEEENEKRYLEAKIRLVTFAQKINGREPAGIEGQYDENEKGELVLYHKNVYRVAEQFRLGEGCDGCGTCAAVCPRNNIRLAGDKPVWGENCDFCLACLHFCPKAAIQNGELSVMCRRQHHPEVTVDDIIRQKAVYR